MSCSLSAEEFSRVDHIIRWVSWSVCQQHPSAKNHFDDIVQYCWLYALRQLNSPKYDRNKSKPQTYIRRYLKNWAMLYLRAEGFIPGQSKKLKMPWRLRMVTETERLYRYL